jgi:WD40 repeat protein
MLQKALTCHHPEPQMIAIFRSRTAFGLVAVGALLTLQIALTASQGQPEPAEEIVRDAFNGENGVPAHIYCTIFAPKGRYFLAAGDAGVRSPVRIYDGKTGKLVSQFTPDEDLGWTGARFSPDGAKVVSWGSTSTKAYVWEAATGKQLFKLEGHKEPVSLANFAPDGKRIVSGSADQTLRVWDAATGKELLVLEGHTDNCLGCFSPDGKCIVSASHDRTLRGWDADTGKELWKQSEQAEPAISIVAGNYGLSPDGRVLSLGSDGNLRVLDAATGKTVVSLTNPADTHGASFLRNGKQVACWARDKTARICDVATGKVVRTIELGDDLQSEPDIVTVSPDGLTLVTGHTDQTVRVRDLATGKEQHRFSIVPRTGTRSLAVAPDGRFAAAGSFRGWVYLWRLPIAP